MEYRNAENINVSCDICGERYPFNCESTKDEEYLRKAAVEVNKMSANLQAQHYVKKNKELYNYQDCLAHIAVMLAKQLIEKEEEEKSILDPIMLKLKDLNGRIDCVIETD